MSELKRSRADSDAVEFLVGHSLGLRGVYTDPSALPLQEAVGLVPRLGVARPVIELVGKQGRGPISPRCSPVAKHIGRFLGRAQPEEDFFNSWLTVKYTDCIPVDHVQWRPAENGGNQQERNK